MVLGLKPRLFISHSTNGNKFVQQSRDLLELLQSSLQNDWEIFVDTQSILPTDPWRQRIVNAMQNADAAIILLDPVSVTRHWVQAESLVFAFRRLVSPTKFQVLPIYLDGLQHDDSKLDFCEPFQLAEIAGINADGQQSHKVVGLIQNSLSPTGRAQSYGGWIVEMLEGLQVVQLVRLREAFCNPSLARSLIEWEPGSERDPQACQIAGSQILHHYSVDETLGCFRYILSGVNSDQHANSARRVYPTRWADNAAIQKLINACYNSSTDCFGIEYLDANMLDLIRDRIKIETCDTIRVCCIDNATPVSPPSMVNHVIGHVYETVCPALPIYGRDGKPMPPAACISHHVQTHERRRILCFLPSSFLTQGFLDRWNTDPSGIAKLVVLVFHREYSHQKTPWEQLGVQTLKPPLDVKRINSYSDLMNALHES